MADVVLQPVSFDPFATPNAKPGEVSEAESVGSFVGDKRRLGDRQRLLILKEQLGDQHRDPTSEPELMKEISDLEGKLGNRGSKIASEMKVKRPAKSILPPEKGAATPAGVTLQPVDGDPFAAPEQRSDFLNLLGQGSAAVVQGVVYPFDKLTNGGLGRIFKEYVGRNLNDIINDVQEGYGAKLSPEQQAAGRKEFISSKDGETFGEAWSDPKAYKSLVVSNLPSMVPGFGAAALASKGARVYGVLAARSALSSGIAPAAAAKAGQEAAVRAAVRLGAAAGGATEGVVGGGQQGAQTEQEIMALPEEKLQQSEFYQNLRKTMTPAEARKQVASDAGTQAMLIAGVVDGITGGAFDAWLAKVLTGGGSGKVLRNIGQGLTREGATETFQSGAEQAATNLAVQQKGDPTRPLMQGVANQAVSGGIAGAAMGAGTGAVAHAGSRPAPAAQAPASGAALELDTGAAATSPAPPQAAAAPLTAIDQARVDAQTLNGGGDLPGADEVRVKNATLLSVYGENAAVRHVIESPGQFGRIGDAMLMAAPSFERVRGTMAQGAQARDITPDIVGAMDEISRIRAEGKTVAEVMAHGVGHEVSYEGQKLAQFLDENIDNPKRIAAFLENYLQEVENATGVPSKVRGRAFDIIQEQHAARKKADEAKAQARVAEAEKADQAKLKKVKDEVARIRAETALTELRAKAEKPEGQSAMEAAFAKAKLLKGKPSAKPRAEGAGRVQAAPRGAAQAGATKGAGPAARSAGAVPKPAQADHRGVARPLREGSNQQGAGEVAVNRGAQIAGELVQGDGTRENPVIVSRPKHINQAAARAAAQPSSAQKTAGNYAKGHFQFDEKHPLAKLGVISIETAKGRERTAHDGTWTVPDMPAHYGHLQIADGKDGDKADITIGDDLNSPHVYVIDQIDPTTKKFDETKSMAGFASKKAAEAVYAKSFTDGNGRARIGAITEMTTAQYVARAQANGLKEAVAYKEPVHEAKQEVPAPSATDTRRKGSSFLMAIRKAGGIRPDELPDLTGEKATLLNRRLPGLVSKTGMTMDGVQEWMQESGYLSAYALNEAEHSPGGTHELVRDMIRRALNDEDVVPMQDEAADMRRRMDEEAIRRGDLEEVTPIVNALAGELAGDWHKMTKEQQDAEVDAIFGPLSGEETPAAPEGAGTGPVAQEAGRDEAARERQPGEDDEVARPPLDLASQTEADLKAKEKQAATGIVEESTAALRDRNEAILSPPEGTAPPASVAEKKVPTQQEALFKKNDTAFSRAKAPVWYSDLARRVEAVNMNSAPANAWKDYLKGQLSKGVKADEIEWSGINDWLDLIRTWNTPAMKAIAPAKLKSLTEQYPNGKVTKDQVLDYLRQNGVRVEETVLGEQGGSTASADDLRVRLDALGYDIETDDFEGQILSIRRRSDGAAFSGELYSDDDLQRFDELPAPVQDLARSYDAAAMDEHDGPREGDTRYQKYTLPGGKNYLELLLTLPEVRGQKKFDPSKVSIERQIRSTTQGSTSISYDGQHLATYSDDPELQPGGSYKQKPDSHWMEVANRLFDKGDERNSIPGKSGAFRSSHFDQTNILAHVRFNERTDAEGKRVLFVEEIQSDWAQKGKREGFSKGGELPAGYDVRKRWNGWMVETPDSGPEEWTLAETSEGAIERFKQRSGYHVPAAPFVGKTEAWVGLALKRMIRWAAENGFDRVAWTTGKQQADRYNLRHQVDKVMAFRRDDGQFDFMVTPKGERGHKDITGVSRDKLADTVGKDLAGKIEAQGKGWKTYEGLDLEIGGEGMLAFYDKILPNIANDVLKKVGGGRVGAARVSIEQEGGDNGAGKWAAVSGFDITPAMREAASSGLPMFSRAPTFERNEDGPILQGDGVGIVQPSLWESRTSLDMYEHTIVDGQGKPIGVITIGWTGDKASFLPNIRILAEHQNQGFGEAVIRSLLEHNGPGHELTIAYIAPSARGYWSKMGGQRIEGLDEDFAQITLESYRNARDRQEGGAAKRGESRQGPQADGESKGGPRAYRRAAGRYEALKPEDVRRIIAPILKNWGNAPKIRVISSVADAPEAVQRLDAAQREGGATGEPEGFIHSGTVYLVSNGLSSEAAVVRALFHESFGHYGLRGILGDRIVSVLHEVVKSQRQRVKAKAREYGLNWDNEDARLMAAEEVLAEMAQTRPTLGVVRRAIAAIRQWLRDLGIKVSLSENDILANFILPARAFVTGGQGWVGGPSTAFSRAGEAGLPSGTFDSARKMFDAVTHSDRVLNRLVSKFNTPFHIAETHPQFKPVYEEAQDYNRDVSRVVNETADLAPELLPRIESFADFGKKAPSNIDISTTADALYAGTLWGGGSPLEGRIWTDEELRSGRSNDKGIGLQVFDPLNGAQVKLYRQALAAVGKSLTEHGRSLAWRLAKQKGIILPQSMSLPDLVRVSDGYAEQQKEGKTFAMAGADAETTARLQQEVRELDSFRKAMADIQAKTEALVAHGYFPAMRFGQYAVNVQSRTIDGGWKEEYFGRFETQTAANLAKKELEKEFPNAKITSGVMNDEAHKLFQGLNLDALELFAQHMTDDEGKSIAIDPIMQEYFRVAVTERSSLKRQIHRKGTPGFSRDVPRALAQFTVSNATSASRNLHAADMLQKVQKIKAGDLQAYATRYVRYLQDPQEESPALRGFLANYYILGSIAFGAVNMTQPVLMTAPYLSQHTSWANAMAQLGRAAKDIVTGRTSLSEEEKAAYAKAMKAGIVSPQEIHQIRAESRASMMGDSPVWQKLEAILATKGLKLPGKLLMRKAAFVWGSIYSMTEQWNRGITFLAAYRIAREKKLGDPYAYAKNAVDATQGVYARSNRPEVSRGPVGSTVMTFKQFSIAYLELAKRLYDTDKKAFAVLMLTLIALAGTEGLPFAEDVEDLLDTIGQWAGHPTNTRKALRKQATSLLGQEIADVLMHGASAIPGVPIDVSARLGMHNIIPGSAILKASEPDKTRDIVDLLGPAAGLFKNVGTAVEGVATGKLGEVKNLLPSALQNVLKAAEMVETGSYRDAKGRRVMNVDAVDAFSKMIGFQPASVARETRIVGQNQQDVALHKVIEDAIASKWAHGMADKDPEAVKDALKRLTEWNSQFPEMRIDISGNQIARRVRDLNMSREQRAVRAAPREIRNDVRQDLRQ